VWNSLKQDVALAGMLDQIRGNFGSSQCDFAAHVFFNLQVFGVFDRSPACFPGLAGLGDFDEHEVTTSSA